VSPLSAHLESFFEALATSVPVSPHVPCGNGLPCAEDGCADGVLVAFSGGSDSLALLRALVELGRHRPMPLWAAHLDHGLDPGSAGRARAAARIAAAAGVPFLVERREVMALRHPGESPEEAARRVRYDFLEEVRQQVGAAWIATAHHRDDQAETVVLRLAGGSGVEGLAGIRPRWGRVIRPLLAMSREELAASHEGWVAATGLAPAADPTNRCSAIARNRIRLHLLPWLAREDPDLPRRLAAVAEAARRAGSSLAARLEVALAPRYREGGIAVPRAAFLALPEALRPAALALLHRRAGAPYPGTGAARQELSAQLARGMRVGCDCGAGWRWESRGADLLLVRSAPPPERFAYTFLVPGEVSIPELGLRLRLHRGARAKWMGSSWPDRAGLALPVTPGDSLVVRSRQPGDRLRPFGRTRRRRLKEVLDSRRMARQRRDRLPLLCVGDEIAWVPGVTVAEEFRLGEAAQTAWIAEIVPEMSPPPLLAPGGPGEVHAPGSHPIMES